MGGAGGGAAVREETEDAVPAREVVLIVSWVEIAAEAVSTVVGDSAVSAAGASRPHSQFEEPSDGSGCVSETISQHEWVSGAGLVGCSRWQSSPSPQRPQGPAIGAAITSPGRSSATIAKIAERVTRLMLIFEQYCTFLNFVKGEAPI